LAFVLVALGAAAVLVGAQARAAQTSLPPLQKIFVWAMGKDAVNVAEVELDLLEELAKHQIAGERASKIFPQGMPASPADAIAQMRAQGCDSLLVLRRVSSVRWESDVPGSSLKSFLAKSAQFLDPKNQAEADSLAPIEVVNASGNAGWEINKGEAVVFDLASQRKRWRGDTQVKSAKDLPQARYYRDVAEKVVLKLVKAGLIPPGRR